MSINNVIPPQPAYRTLLQAIGEGVHDMYGPSWTQAEVACRELWSTYERTTGLSWSEVRLDIQGAFHRAERTPASNQSSRCRHWRAV